GEAFEQPLLAALDVRDGLRDIDAARRRVAAAHVRDRDDPAARFGEGLRGDAADVAEALHRDAGVLRRAASALHGLERHERDAATGRLGAPARTTELYGLSRDDSGRMPPGHHRHRVDDP